MNYKGVSNKRGKVKSVQTGSFYKTKGVNMSISKRTFALKLLLVFAITLALLPMQAFAAPLDGSAPTAPIVSISPSAHAASTSPTAPETANAPATSDSPTTASAPSDSDSNTSGTANTPSASNTTNVPSTSDTANAPGAILDTVAPLLNIQITPEPVVKDPLNPTIAVADANPNIVLALEEENFQDIDADAVVVTIKRANNDFIVVCVKDFVQDAVNLNVWSYTSDSLPDGIYDIVVNTQLTDAAGNVLDVPVDALAPVPMNFKVCALPEIQTELTFSQSINALELIKTEQDVQNPAIKSVDNVTLIYCGEEKSIIEGISVNASDYLILSSTDSNSANILAYRATENIFLGAGAASDVTFSIKIQIGYRNNDEGILRYKTASVLTHKAILTLAPQVLPFGSNLQLIPNSDEFLDDQLQFIYNAQECVLAKPNLNGLALNVKGLFNTSIANSVLVFDKYVNPQTGIYPGYTNFYLLKWGSATLTSAASNNIVLANDDVLLGNYFSFYKERLLRTHEMVYSLIDDVDANGQSTQVMVAAVYDSATATTWVRSKDVMLKHNGYDFWPEPEDLSGFSASVQKYDGSPISFTETSNYYAKLQVSAAHPENEKYVFPVGAISYDGSEPQVVDVVFQEPVVKKDGWIAYMDETTIKVRLADGGIAIASADATGNAGDASGSGSTGSASSSGSTGNSGTTGDASDAADSATDANATDNSSQESVSGISQATLYYQGAKLDTQVANSSDEEIVTLSFKLGPSDTAYLMQDFTISASDRAGNELSSYSLDAYLRSNDGTVDSDLQGGLQGDLQDGSQVASAAIASTSNVSSKTNNDANTLDGVEAIIVDAVSPVVSVNFNNNLAQNEKYYNAARIATISVNEAHFAQAIELNPSSAIASYSIDNKEPIKLLARAFNRSSDDPNVWQATIAFNADGAYSLTCSATDFVGHLSNSVTTDFVIDTIAPVIDVSFDNNDASSVNYYKASRKATIKVKELNFSPELISVSAIPTLSGWVKESTHDLDDGRINDIKDNIWVATLFFSEEGEYTLDVSGLDLAGNSAKDFSEPNFIIDTTLPIIQIQGVQDSTAYSEDLRPEITFSDANFDPILSEVSIKGANGSGFTYLKNSETISETERKITYENYPYELRYDDVYTLRAHVSDKAGNEETQEIIFSVNRYGSTYQLAEECSDIPGSYLPKSRDVIIYETNVSGLVSSDVSLSKNDSITLLSQTNHDYLLNDVGLNNSWSRYAYIIPAEQFNQSGFYRLLLSSRDSAGNLNSNQMQGKNADRTAAFEVAFAVDTVAPRAYIQGVDSGTSYQEASKKVEFFAGDNIALQNATLYVNGAQVASWDETQLNQAEDGVKDAQLTYLLKASDEPQSLEFVVVDKAGNTAKAEANELLIGTGNSIITTLAAPLADGIKDTFGIPAIAFALILAGFAAVLFFSFLFIKRRKKEEEDKTSYAIN